MIKLENKKAWILKNSQNNRQAAKNCKN